MARGTTELLSDILEAATDASGYVADMDLVAFNLLPLKDGKTYRAIKNAVCEIGEAVKGLPDDLKDRHPNIDWRGIAALRDIVMHQYHRLDTERLWPVLIKEFPDLVSAVQIELNIDPTTVHKP